jgi:hypothetical protein
MYKENENGMIERTNEDGTISFIPKDEANADYRRYLNPEAEQSTPMVAGDE